MFADGDETTLAIALLVLPTICSPTIALVWTLAVEVNWISSNVGSELSNDS